MGRERERGRGVGGRLEGAHVNRQQPSTLCPTPPAPVQADICQLGLDQRKVNVLAREYCDSIKRKFKPVVLSHAMVPGLLGAASVDVPVAEATLGAVLKYREDVDRVRAVGLDELLAVARDH